MRYYLDANSSYGIDSDLIESLTSEIGDFLNPSSVHQEGQGVRGVLDRARRRLYEVLGVSENEFHLVYTSGATEANNSSVHSVLFNRLAQGVSESPENVVSSSVEHSSLREPLRRLSRSLKIELREVSPEKSSQQFIEEMCSAVDASTSLVTLMWVNNETGQIFPVREVFSRVRGLNPNCTLHCDAAHLFGKLSFDLSDLPFDSLSIAPHKLGALPGIGVHLVRKSSRVEPLLLGGAQELRMRAGTENLLGILSVDRVLDRLKTFPELFHKTIGPIRDRLERELTTRYPKIQVLGASWNRVPNTSFLHIPGVRSDDLVVSFDLAGIACSSGSACSSGKMTGSDVVRGLGLSEEVANEVIRFSFRADFSPSHYPDLVKRVCSVLDRVLK